MSRKFIFSDVDIEFIRNNYLLMSNNDMAYFLNVDKGVLRRFCKEIGCICPISVMQKNRSEKQKLNTTSTPEIDAFIHANYLTMPIKTLANRLNKSDSFIKTRLRQLSLVIPQEVISQRKIDSQIKKGSIPPNKGKTMDPEVKARVKHTFFPKGHLPKNTLSDGEITVRRRYSRNTPPYKFIRLSLGKWEFLHRHIWMQQNGPIPKGMIVVFKDYDTMNCDITNLELISLEKNMLRNSFRNYPEEIVSTIETRSLLTRTINKISKK